MDKVTEIHDRIVLLREIEDNHYMIATYLLDLAQKPHELAASSELEEWLPAQDTNLFIIPGLGVDVG